MLLIGKPSISIYFYGPFSMAMLNNQRVDQMGDGDGELQDSQTFKCSMMRLSWANEVRFEIESIQKLTNVNHF